MFHISILSLTLRNVYILCIIFTNKYGSVYPYVKRRSFIANSIDSYGLAYPLLLDIRGYSKNKTLWILTY